MVPGRCPHVLPAVILPDVTTSINLNITVGYEQPPEFVISVKKACHVAIASWTLRPTTHLIRLWQCKSRGSSRQVHGTH